jgi:single-stranded DNA-specific DHH superfamily exonuclease
MIAGTLLYKTLVHLDHPPDLISVQHLDKGQNVHGQEERARMQASGAERIVILDQGSRPDKALVTPSSDHKRVLIVDHHWSTEVGKR